MNKRIGQSAIEYLMTYGWMLLAVAIAGGAVYSIVGDQSIQNISGFNSNEINVDDFGMTPSGLQINIEAYGANPITLKEIQLESSNQNITVPIRNDIAPGDNNVLNIPHLQRTEEHNDIEAKLVYDTGSLQNIATTGIITGNLRFDNSLIGYWPLRESQANSTHVFDVSQYQNHGTFHGDYSWGSSEEIGGINVNGSVRFGDKEIFELTDELTIAALYRSDHYAESWDGIFGKSNGSCHDDKRGYTLTSHSGTLGLTVRTCSVVPEGTDPDQKNLHNSGEWHSIVATEDGEYTKFYTDGELIAERGSTGTAYNASGSDLSLQSFDGEISSIKLFNRTLEPNEIKSLHENSGLIK